MDKKQKDKSLNENSQQKNPYQEFMDMPDDMIVDAKEGIELVRQAVLWELRNKKP